MERKAIGLLAAAGICPVFPSSMAGEIILIDNPGGIDGRCEGQQVRA